LPRTVPVEIGPTSVTLAPTRGDAPVDGGRIKHPTDFVLLCTGYVADLNLFEQAGVTFEGPPGKVPQFDPDTMETSVPGLYVAGTAASGQQARHKLFIETSHHHVTKIVKNISGRTPTRVNRLVPEGPDDFSL
jgi:thioredoxin reductase (NADPH)